MATIEAMEKPRKYLLIRHEFESARSLKSVDLLMNDMHENGYRLKSFQIIEGRDSVHGKKAVMIFSRRDHWNL